MPHRHISDLVEEVAPSEKPSFAGTTKKTGWAYAIAVVVPFLEVAIRLTFAPVLNDEPFLELFLFPILLSAFLGGLKPGLTATILSALTAAYFLLPPLFSFSLASKTDQAELFSLVVLGTLVSLLFDSTHHNEKRPKQEPNSHHWQAIAWKTQMFFGIGLTSLAIVGIFSFRSILNLRAEAEHLKRAQNAIIQFRQTFFAVSELQLTQRNYVITGDAADLATYFAAVKEVNRQIINLHQQTAQSQEQLKLVEEVEITINQRIDLAQSTIEKRQVEGFPAAQRFIQEGKGARLNEEIQHRLEISEALARQEMANAETRTRRIGQTTQTVIVGSSILAFCFVAIGSFLLRRDFAGRGRAEAALQEEREHLEVRVAERTGELAQTVATVTQTKALLQTVIENLAEGVIISDLNGSLVLWNEVGLAMHGFENVKEWSYHLPELQNIFELSTLEGNFIPFEEWPLPRIIRGETVTNLDVLIRRSDCDWKRVFSYSGTQAQEPDGRLLAVMTTIDIGERFAAQNKILENEQLLSAIIGSAMDGILTVDQHFQVTQFNHAAETMFGCESHEVMGADMDRFFSAQSLRQIREHIKPFSTEQNSGPLAGRLEKIEGVRADGRKFPLEASFSRVWVKGRTHYNLTVRDITERQRAEAEIRLWADAFEHCAHGIAIGDPATNTVRTCNPAFAQLIGKKPEEIQGERILTLYAPEESQRIQNYIRLADQTGQIRYETKMVTADGSCLPVQMDLVSVKGEDGQPLYRVATMQDITERKQAQDTLQRFVGSSPAVIYALSIDEKGNFTPAWVSPNIFAMTGFQPEETLSFGWWKKTIHEDDRGRVINSNSQLQKVDELVVEFRVYRKDGSILWVRDAKRILRDQDGKRFELVGAWSDITERVELEEQFRQSQKMESIGGLAAGIAHDFNNLLTVISGHSDLILKHAAKTNGLKEQVLVIKQAGERAAALTSQLLAFSRKQILAPKIINPNELIVGLANMLRPMIGEDVTFTTDLAADACLIKVDPGQLEQVFINLAVNARDAMPQGGKLAFATNNVVLDEVYCRSHPECTPGVYVRFTVTDTGCGMTTEIKDRIFDPFFTTKEVGKGTGLGLSMVFGIIKQSNGHIGVSSQVGTGTCFTIYLPAVRKTEPSGEYKKPEVLPASSETILVVEDDSLVRDVTTQILETFGFRVLEAGSGKDALTIAQGYPDSIHLLLTDVVMPEMGGRQVAEQLLTQYPDLKVLFMSGYIGDAIVHHGVSESSFAFLQKPFSAQELVQKIKQVLKQD